MIVKLASYEESLQRWRDAIEKKKGINELRTALLEQFPPVRKLNNMINSQKKMKRKSLFDEDIFVEVDMLEYVSLLFAVEFNKDNSGVYTFISSSLELDSISVIDYRALRDFAETKKRAKFLPPPAETLLLECDMQYSKTKIINDFKEKIDDHFKKYEKKINSLKKFYAGGNLAYWERVQKQKRHGVQPHFFDFNIFYTFIECEDLSKVLDRCLEFYPSESETGYEKFIIRRIISAYKLIDVKGLSCESLLENKKTLSYILRKSKFDDIENS